MEINGDKYHITYDSAVATVACKGALLLRGTKEYEPILQLFKFAAEQQMKSLTLDLHELKFLNSSGLNMMIKFVNHVSGMEQRVLDLTIMGDKRIIWQDKLARNLQRLNPGLRVIFESERDTSPAEASSP